MPGAAFSRFISESRILRNYANPNFKICPDQVLPPVYDAKCHNRGGGEYLLGTVFHLYGTPPVRNGRASRSTREVE